MLGVGMLGVGMLGNGAPESGSFGFGGLTTIFPLFYFKSEKPILIFCYSIMLKH
jgi:hypothetical protein